MNKMKSRTRGIVLWSFWFVTFLRGFMKRLGMSRVIVYADKGFRKRLPSQL